MSKTGPHSLIPSVERRLNLIGTFNISRLAAWQMSTNEPEDEERGVIINTASIAAFEGQIGQVAYTASKAAIAGMCLTMARDLQPRYPRAGDRAEPLRHRADRGYPRRVRQAAHQGRVPEAPWPPEEYAKLALAIVENLMLNGQCIRLDAGQRCPEVVDFGASRRSANGAPKSLSLPTWRPLPITSSQHWISGVRRTGCPVTAQRLHRRDPAFR